MVNDHSPPARGNGHQQHHAQWRQRRRGIGTIYNGTATAPTYSGTITSADGNSLVKPPPRKRTNFTGNLVGSGTLRKSGAKPCGDAGRRRLRDSPEPTTASAATSLFTSPTAESAAATWNITAACGYLSDISGSSTITSAPWTEVHRECGQLSGRFHGHVRHRRAGHQQHLGRKRARTTPAERSPPRRRSGRGSADASGELALRIRGQRTSAAGPSSSPMQPRSPYAIAVTSPGVLELNSSTVWASRWVDHQGVSGSGTLNKTAAGYYMLAYIWSL